MDIKIAWINTCPPQEILASVPHIHVTLTKLFIFNHRNHCYQIWAVKTTYLKSRGRACSSCFIHAIVAHIRLSFFKMFSNFQHFSRNFQIFCPFLPFFSEKSYACPYFSEQVLIWHFSIGVSNISTFCKTAS